MIRIGILGNIGSGKSNTMEAASESDESTRQSLYYDLADLEHDKALYIWGSQSIGYKIWREWVNGWYHNMMHSTLFYTLSKS